MKYIYSDSLIITMTKPFHDLVKPGLEDEWNTKIFPKYFVQDPNCVDQNRTPGLFKEEAVINHGSMIALRDTVNNYLIIVNTLMYYIYQSSNCIHLILYCSINSLKNRFLIALYESISMYFFLVSYYLILFS